MVVRVGNAYYDTSASEELYHITSKSTLLVDDDLCETDRKSPKYWEETLYRRPRGELWVLGQGGGHSMYRSYYQGATMWGSHVRGHQTWEMIRAWLTERIGELEAGDVLLSIQDDRAAKWRAETKKTMCVYVPPEVQRHAQALAGESRKSMSRLITDMIEEKYYNSRRDDLADLGLG